jgi:hypothetical protein
MPIGEDMVASVKRSPVQVQAQQTKEHDSRVDDEGKILQVIEREDNPKTEHPRDQTDHTEQAAMHGQGLVLCHKVPELFKQTIQRQPRVSWREQIPSSLCYEIERLARRSAVIRGFNENIMTRERAPTYISVVCPENISIRVRGHFHDAPELEHTQVTMA